MLKYLTIFYLNLCVEKNKNCKLNSCLCAVYCLTQTCEKKKFKVLFDLKVLFKFYGDSPNSDSVSFMICTKKNHKCFIIF